MGTHIYKSNNWSIFTGNTGDGMECIFDRDSDTIMYLESQNGIIMKTINTYPLFDWVCCISGSGVNAAGGWITPFIMHPNNDSILLVGKSQVWRSTNCGVSFTQVGNVTGGSTYLVSMAYAPSNPNFIYATKSNKLFVCTDGLNFQDRTTGLPVGSASITSLTVSQNNPSKLWVTFSGYSSVNKVWLSSDTGRTWTNYSTGLPNLPVNCIVYQNNTNNALYVGTDVGVYYINDTLTNWQPFFDGLPNVDVQELEISYEVNKIRAATNGRGLWESDLMYTDSFNGSQTIQLKNGWNMISSNLIATNDSIADIMKVVKSNTTIMKNGIGNTYIPAFNIDNIKHWNYLHGYQLYMSNADSLIIFGTQIKPDTVKMMLNSGWSMISYLRNSEISTPFAFNSMTDRNSLLICKDGYGKNYIPQFNINTIGNMKPGYGYQVYLIQKDTLNYPANSGGKLSLKEFTPMPKILQPTVNITGNCSTILIKLNTKDSNEIGIYSSRGTLIGSGVVINEIAAITVWGEDEYNSGSEGAKSGETLTASLYDVEENTIKLLNIDKIDSKVGSQSQNLLTYQKDAFIIVHASISISDVNDIYDAKNNLFMSPNPVKSESIIKYTILESGKVNLSIIDLMGRKVRTLFDDFSDIGSYELKFDSEGMINGQYSLCLEYNSNKIITRLVILK